MCNSYKYSSAQYKIILCATSGAFVRQQEPLSWALAWAGRHFRLDRHLPPQRSTWTIHSLVKGLNMGDRDEADFTQHIFRSEACLGAKGLKRIPFHWPKFPVMWASCWWVDCRQAEATVKERQTPYPEVSSNCCRPDWMNFDPCANPFSCDPFGTRKD